jgi:hypothetical protein
MIFRGTFFGVQWVDRFMLSSRVILVRSVLVLAVLTGEMVCSRPRFIVRRSSDERDLRELIRSGQGDVFEVAGS